ncbi:MAG TPA: cation:proton antiporter [Steroidobacteraceae bacterium]|nr:cation:proton antiporter [Steroidobacteraceae bacterium]
MAPTRASAQGHLRRLLASGAAVALLSPALCFAASGANQGASEALFLAQLLLLIAAGRLLGELMQRLGQPAIMGQLIAGILLGPSVFGALLPDLWHRLFPSGREQQAMLAAVAHLGVLLLLVLTGMEADLSVVRNSRRAAFSVSIAGIALPFACGFLLTELLPAALLPDPGKRLVTALFMGVALSISSVKIVALLVGELGFLRRTVGQVIVASAIIDDTIGWITIAIVFGLARPEGIDTASVLRSVLGTAVFLALSFTVGRRVVSRLIRWANDAFVSELPVVTMALVIMAVMALLTDAIGVHTVLGAFIAGILIGQTPIRARHIDEQLRGLITALFMPVFFGMAGLSADLTVLAQPALLGLTAVLIAVASIGKFLGAMIGGRIGGLTRAESLAVGCGMNARGSTEIIIATVGLSLGVLNSTLFTAILAMAMVTTLSMPPLLRWSFGRVEPTAAERERLQREAAEQASFISRIERLLVAVDGSPTGQLASHLGGVLAGVRGITTTAIHLNDEPGGEATDAGRVERTAEVLTLAAESGGRVAEHKSAEGGAGDSADVKVRAAESSTGQSEIAAEKRKGYGALVLGREPLSEGAQFDPQVTRMAREFGDAVILVSARGTHQRSQSYRPLKILVPVTGTPVSRHGAELAVALAEGSRGRLTALYIVGMSSQRRPAWGTRIAAALAPAGTARAVIRDVEELGRSYGVAVNGIARNGASAADLILREIEAGRYDLTVLGVSPRPGEQLFFGDTAAMLLRDAPSSLVFLSSEPGERG